MSTAAMANDTASAMNDALRPKATVKRPPRAAPTASIDPHVDDITAVAVGRSSGSTRLGMAACDAGLKNAARNEIEPCAAKAIQARPAPTSRKERAATVWMHDTNTMSRRRSKWSAAVPESGVAMKLGNICDTKTPMAARSECVRSSTRPRRATVANQSPMKDTTCAQYR